jgi:hypothetical protein
VQFLQALNHFQRRLCSGRSTNSRAGVVRQQQRARVARQQQEFADHYFLFLPSAAPNSRCYALHAGWRAVFTSAESFSTLRLCSSRSTSSRAGVARQQQCARPLWRRSFGATYQLFEDPFPQERTQLGCGVMKFSLTRTQLPHSSRIIILWARHHSANRVTPYSYQLKFKSKVRQLQ